MWSGDVWGVIKKCQTCQAHDSKIHTAWQKIFKNFTYDHFPHSSLGNTLWVFQVPKTTIWRKLQQGSRPELAEPVDNEADTAAAQLQERTEFAFSEVWYSTEFVFNEVWYSNIMNY